MTDPRLVFVCEESPGFARLAAAVASSRGAPITAVGGSVGAAGYVHKRLADVARSHGYDVAAGRAEPIDAATVHGADRVVAMGEVPDWVTAAADVVRWQDSYPSATGPNATRNAVERVERRVAALPEEPTSAEVARPVSSSSD